MIPSASPKVDYIAGSESATDLVLVVACPACCSTHPVTLSSLGRFAFHCDGTDMTGAVEPAVWQSLRANGAARGPGEPTAGAASAEAKP